MYSDNFRYFLVSSMRLFLCSFLAIGCLFSVSVGAGGPDGAEDIALFIQNHEEEEEVILESATSMGNVITVGPHGWGSWTWWKDKAHWFTITGLYKDEHSRCSTGLRRVRNFAAPVIAGGTILVLTAWKAGAFSGEEENTTSPTTGLADTTWAVSTNSTVSATPPPASDTNFSCHAASSQEVMLDWIANACGIDLNDVLARGFENLSDFFTGLCANKTVVTCDNVQAALQALTQGSTPVAETATSAFNTFGDANDQFTTSISSMPAGWYKILECTFENVSRLQNAFYSVCFNHPECYDRPFEEIREVSAVVMNELCVANKLSESNLNALAEKVLDKDAVSQCRHFTESQVKKMFGQLLLDACKSYCDIGLDFITRFTQDEVCFDFEDFPLHNRLHRVQEVFEDVCYPRVVGDCQLPVSLTS